MACAEIFTEFLASITSSKGNALLVYTQRVPIYPPMKWSEGHAVGPELIRVSFMYPTPSSSKGDGTRVPISISICWSHWAWSSWYNRYLGRANVSVCLGEIALNAFGLYSHQSFKTWPRRLDHPHTT